MFKCLVIYKIGRYWLKYNPETKSDKEVFIKGLLCAGKIFNKDFFVQMEVRNA